MPGGDGTGPFGYGPMTGRGAGYCAGFPGPGYANPHVPPGGWAARAGWGVGLWGRGWGYRGNRWGGRRYWGGGLSRRWLFGRWW